MALGTLGIINFFIIILAIVFQSLLYFKKDNKKAVFILNFIFSLVLVFVAYTSYPTNYTLQRTIAGLLGLLSFLSLFGYIRSEDKNINKFLLTFSIIGSIFQILF